MFELLKKLHDEDIEMSFLVPGVGGSPLKGKVEAITQQKVTILCSIQGVQVRLVTHPNSAILIEQG